MMSATCGREVSYDPFRVGERLAAFSGGVAPGYYIVPLRGRTPMGAAGIGRVAILANPRRGFIKLLYCAPAGQNADGRRRHWACCDPRESPKGIHKVAGGSAPGKRAPKMA
jgi:hypothetical protein